MGVDRKLGWYRHLVHNRSVPGSLFTLLHLPFMLAFLSLALLGTFTIKNLEANANAVPGRLRSAGALAGNASL